MKRLTNKKPEGLIRILHASTAHQPTDPRITVKQCPTLAAEYEVICALPGRDRPGRSGRGADEVRYVRLPYFQRVLWRALITAPLVLIHALRLRPAVFHLYTPELLPVAFLLRIAGVKIIYEVQENLYKKFHLKPHGPALRSVFGWFDRWAQRHCWLIFTDHGYRDTYQNVALPSVVIYNYPHLPALEPFRTAYAPNGMSPRFFYVGWMSFERAFDTLLDALAILKTRYPAFQAHFFGSQTFTEADVVNRATYQLVKDNIHRNPYTAQDVALPSAAGATAGLALLKPVGDYPESYTTKLFEYMALGLPVVTSDFPLYKDVVERHRCGLCVSPTDPAAIADALTYLIEHPDEARQMGERGRSAVETEYNWTTEDQKLRQFYRLVLDATLPSGK